MAAKLVHKLPRHVGPDEVSSAAYVGLIDAVENFDPDRNVGFRMFCRRRISGAVMDWLRHCDNQSRSIRRFERQRASIHEELELDLCRPPTQEEVAERMELPMKRYNKLSRISQAGQEITFSTIDACSNNKGGNPSTNRTWEMSDPDEEGPSARIEKQFTQECICRGLNDTERLLIMMYYGENLSLAKIGLILELSESRVSQIHKDVIARLQQRFRNDAEAEKLVA
jgi:RNA polymerase sigma factor for flagellar operon FliA